MIFVLLYKFRKKLTKEIMEQYSKVVQALMEKSGLRPIANYWVLARCDGIGIFEGPNAESMLKYSMAVSEMAEGETMVAFPREEAVKLID